MSDEAAGSSRRDFLTGRAVQRSVEQVGERIADELVDDAARQAPVSSETVRLGKQAMACDFDVILNPGQPGAIRPASDALDVIDLLEDQMSVYREHSELSLLNRRAADEPVEVEAELYALLRRAEIISRQTEGGFDPTAGPIVDLWRRCKAAGRAPSEAEVQVALDIVGLQHVSFDDEQRTVRFSKPGVELNLNSIGKGYALDKAAEVLTENGVNDWLFHGGHSSLLARGSHGGLGGWPVGIRNPLFPDQRLGTILLKDCGMSSSGSGVQYFRHGGKRYGHILDPRSGWPVESMLSVTVLAPTAALADALSTAFFVVGLEKAAQYCHNETGVSALLIPPPAHGRRLEPVNIGMDDDILFLTPEDNPA